MQTHAVHLVMTSWSFRRGEPLALGPSACLSPSAPSSGDSPWLTIRLKGQGKLCAREVASLGAKRRKEIEEALARDACREQVKAHAAAEQPRGAVKAAWMGVLAFVGESAACEWETAMKALSREGFVSGEMPSVEAGRLGARAGGAGEALRRAKYAECVVEGQACALAYEWAELMVDLAGLEERHESA